MMDKLRGWILTAQQYAKAIVAGVGTLLVAVSGLSGELGLNLVPAEVQPWISFGLAVLTAFATWAVPNVDLWIEVDETELDA
jgi:hypothetical protein